MEWEYSLRFFFFIIIYILFFFTKLPNENKVLLVTEKYNIVMVFL